MMPDACEAKRTPAGDAFAANDDAFERLKAAVETLISRLEPVLNSDNPVDVVTKECAPLKQVCHSALVDKIYNNTDKMSNLNMAVQSALQRLEV